MTDAHTPTAGPWKLETVKTSCGICHKIGPFPWRDDKENHACIYVDDDLAWKHGAELEANAQLIAAAPMMLEALENIENDDEHMPPTAWELIQDAIKAARGES